MSETPAVVDQEFAANEQGWATTPVRYFYISFFWLPLSIFWGMMLPRIVPTRVEEFAGALHKGAYLTYLVVPGALTSAVIQLLIGPISDHCASRYGKRRPFLIVGTLGAIAGMWAFACAQTFPGLIVSFFSIQLLLNMANGPYQAFIPDQVARRHQGIASAWMGLMQLLGEAGGPVLAGVLLGTKLALAHPDPAIRQIMLITSALMLAALVVTVLNVPDSPSTEPLPPMAAAKLLLDVRPQEHPDFFRLLYSRAVFNLGFYIAVSFLKFYIQDSLHMAGAAESKALMYIQLVTLASALVATFPTGWLADKIDKKTLVYASCGLSAVSGIAFAFAPGYHFALAMTVFFGLGYGVFRAVDWAFACNLLPPGGAAKYMAIWSLSVTLPQVAAPAYGPIGDIINRDFGIGMGWRVAMLVTVVCALAGAAMIRTVNEKVH